MRATPFGLVFADLAAERFPPIADALERDMINAADRDHFVLLEPVGRLLREIVPQEVGADALEAHVLLLHHAYLHWVAGSRTWQIDEQTLAQAARETTMTSRLPHPAFYLQMPELRVWGTPTEGSAPEPLDGIFVAETIVPGGISVLGIFGMRPDRPGFSAVGLEGHADAADSQGGEIEVAAARGDGSAPFGPMLAGGTKAGLHSLANPGELLLLTCRLLALLTAKDVP
jgi:hypothetical protein